MPGIQKTRRLIQILMRLQNGRSYNSTQLAEFCGVSSRTLFRDLRELLEAGVPILHDSHRQGYWIPLRETSAPMRLSTEEALSMLLLCEQGGSRQTGIPFLDPAAQASHFILTQLPNDQRVRLLRLTSLIDINLQTSESPPPDRTQFEQVLQAMDQRVQVRVHFHLTSPATPSCTLLSPYRLLFQDQAWQVIGRSSWHRSTQIFPMSAIVRAEITNNQYLIPPRFQTHSYLTRKKRA